MHGTDYEDNLFFYHDALTQMTHKDAVDYMKSKDIYKHWILPKLDVNINTKWANSPTVNSPEFNPLDCNLFKDLHDAVKLNLLLIHRGRTDSESEPKLDMNGSKNVEESYKYIMIHLPNDERIHVDVNKTPYNFLRVYYNY